MFHATELATLAQYHLPVIVILCNDSGYGVLRWLQDTRFGRINETDLGKVAFADMAKSMGVPGTRVKDTNAFDEALATAIKAGVVFSQPKIHVDGRGVSMNSNALWV